MFKYFSVFLCSSFIALHAFSAEVYVDGHAKTQDSPGALVVAPLSDKEIIQPYFDEAFYVANYSEKVERSGLEPIDHFLKHGLDGDCIQHCDPNDWFNVSLYKERLWPCEGNPFVDFFSFLHSQFLYIYQMNVPLYSF